MTLVLGRTRLATRHKVVAGQFVTRTAHSRRTHALHHIVVGRAAGLREVTTGEGRVERFALHLPDHVRHIIVAPVGNRRTQIGNLQRCQQHLALTDGDGDDGQAVPRAPVVLVIKRGIWNQTALLAGEVDAEPVAESHADHIVAPGVHRFLHGAVFRNVRIDHVIEPPAEEAVARRAQRRH